MKKKKHYEVNIKAFSTVVVMDAENEKDAIMKACDAVRFGDFEMDEAEVGCVIPAQQIESSRRHANAIVEDE